MLLGGHGLVLQIDRPQMGGIGITYGEGIESGQTSYRSIEVVRVDMIEKNSLSSQTLRVLL